MKVVVVRSDVGFGDRLITITSAMAYAMKTKRMLVIDFRDSCWCGSDKKNTYYDFDYYYDVKLNYYIPLKKFLTLYEKNKFNWSVWPNYVKVLNIPYSKKMNNHFDIAAQKNRDELGYSRDIFIDIMNGKQEDLKENVVFFYQYVTRPIQTLKFFQGFVMKEPLKKVINEDPFKINILNKGIKYNVVHLRGTDRMDNNSFSNGSNNVNDYVEKIYNKIDSDIENILVISDTQILIDTFIDKYKDKFIIHQTNNIKSKNNDPLHTAIYKNKLRLNLEMLKDFYFLLRSENIYADKISYFSACPILLKKYSKCKSPSEVDKVDEYITIVGKDMGILNSLRELRKTEQRNVGIIN